MLIIVISITILLVCAIMGLGFWGTRRMTQAPKKSHEFCWAIGKKRNLYDRADFKQFPQMDVEIESHDGLKLRGIYYEPFPEEKKVVIIVHGYTVSYPWSIQFAPMFMEERFNCLLIDQRAHGRSEGAFTTFGELEKYDVQRWVRWVKGHKGTDCIIGFHGQSLGGATVLEYSRLAEKEIPFMIIDCAYADFSQLILYQVKQLYKVPVAIVYPILALFARVIAGFRIGQLKPIEAAAMSEFPILFIHGLSDRFIPSSMSKQLYESKSKGFKLLELIPNAGHGDSLPQNREQYEQAVRTFLRSIAQEYV